MEIVSPRVQTVYLPLLVAELVFGRFVLFVWSVWFVRSVILQQLLGATGEMSRALKEVHWIM